MKLRLILALIISVVCFAGGMGIVAMLKKMSDDATMSSSEEYEIDSALITDDSGIQKTESTKDKKIAKQINKTEKTEKSAVDKKVNPEDVTEPEETKTEQVEKNIKNIKDVKEVVNKEEPGKEDMNIEPDIEDPEIIEEDLDKKWWLGLRGHRCYIDFGNQRALIVRAGKLEKDQVASYSSFGKNKKITTLRKKNNPVVRPIAFGFHPADGEPNLVYLSIRGEDGHERMKGILSLRISGEKLKLKLKKKKTRKNKDKEKTQKTGK